MIEIKSATLIATVMFLASCASTNNTGAEYIDVYDAESYTPEQIATLFVPDNIYISELDGERLPSGYAYSGAAIRTLPGQHSAKINYGSAGQLSQQGSLSFSLERPENYFMQLSKSAQANGTVVEFKIFECGGEHEKQAIKARRANSTGSYQAPCPKN